MKLYGLKPRVRVMMRRLLSPMILPQESLLLGLGRQESLRVQALPPDAPVEAIEFKISSQFGEDGIIQHIIAKATIEQRRFVEFGVEDYSQSNTRFLLQNNNWQGLILDAGTDHIRFLRHSGLASQFDIRANSAFITAENIDGLLKAAQFTGDIGLLSIDIDGMDYWLLRAISAVQPRIVVVEYNSLYGPNSHVTVPYDPNFNRFSAHYSGLYYGASISAISDAAGARGYDLVATNSAGNNAFFVRRDVRGALPVVAPSLGWRPSRFRESRDERGRRTYISSLSDRRRLVAHLPLLDLDTGSTITVGDLPPLPGDPED